MAGLYPMSEGTQMDELRAWLGLHGADPNEVPITEDMTITTDDDGVQWLNWAQFALVNGKRYTNVMGTGAAVEKRTARLSAPPPDWWEPIVHPTREELIARLDAVRTVATAMGGVTGARFWAQQLNAALGTRPDEQGVPIAWCGASLDTGIGTPLGPCVLRHDHDGPVHQDAHGATWWPTSTGPAARKD